MFAAGTTLGSYEILSLLGAGGMGEVYRARDRRLGREVALKVLPAEVASSPDRLARFEREARTVAGLNHPSIVTLFSVEDEAGVRFLTMELVEGKSLTDAIPPGGLALDRLLQLAIPLVDALAAAHERGVVHRDLKPGNVMVTREGRVKVLDFGLAKPVREDSSLDSSRAATMSTPISTLGDMVGTVPYMAPEQVRGEAVDGRTDLFALGILLYELATGRRPFGGETHVDVAHAILRGAPEPLTRIRRDLPADFERIVGRCLEKDPRERAQSALDVASELRRLRRLLDHGAPTGPDASQVASIAVLPFVNRGGGEEDEYFSDGLADELLNVLAKIRGLRVISRTSSFQFRGTKDDVAAIGRKLDVATLLEGSVRRAGNRVRISVQLVQVADSSHLWSETYDRTLEDIFALQDDIAQSVVKELRTTLLGERADTNASGQARADVARAAKGRGTDPEAYRLYLLSRHFMARRGREDVAQGIVHLKEALARGPEFALAWAQLGAMYAKEADLGWAPVGEAYGRAREAAERSLALEPDLAEAHALLGRIALIHDRDWREAEARFGRALRLEPRNVMVLVGAASLAMYLGRSEDAIRLYRSALEQDPLAAGAHHNLGYAYYCSSRYIDAEESFRKALDVAPQRGVTRAYLALALLARGRGEEALTEAMREPQEALRLYALAVIHRELGQATESDAALQRMIEAHAIAWAYQIAGVHALRGEADAAFEWLERAYVQHDGGLSEMKVTRDLRSLHGDPRWGAFLRKMRFES